MACFQFLKQKTFYINLLIIITLFVALFFLTFEMLDTYTRHGQEYLMPNLIGQNFDNVKKEYENELNFILVDSVYHKDELPGTIVQQDPHPDAKIKKGRNVYYVVVAKTAEKVDMPNLRNLSLRQASVLLLSKGLEIKELVYVDHFAENAVFDQKLGNEIIEPGTELVKGSAVTLLMGLGNGTQETSIPNLIGTSADKVREILLMSGLNLGEQVFENNDSIQHQRVYKMTPPMSLGKTTLGTAVKLWYRSDKMFDFEKEKQALLQADSTEAAIEREANAIDQGFMMLYSTDSTLTNTYHYEDTF